ncbi:MAG TPA: heme o synthase [Candidatus Acidoferrum sp.]|nr:heme o synthase [Candidatus Acidoferrum sp.]
MRPAISDFIALTKPTIMLLVLFTGATALVLEGSLLHDPIRFTLVLLGLFLTGGSANALNQVFERSIDARMSRTRRRRPLPLGKLTVAQALTFSVAIGVIGVALFAYFFNWLTALLALATILFYSLVYTLLLKPHTTQNIVIGGIAGAMAPVGAWAAATGGTALAPWLLFLIVVVWTPPHFWALALICKDDYATAQLPMLPVVKGDDATYRQILIYTVVLVGVSLAMMAVGAGLVYLVPALALGGWFVVKVRQSERRRTPAALHGLFGYSIIYLFALFIAVMLDRVI